MIKLTCASKSVETQSGLTILQDCVTMEMSKVEMDAVASVILKLVGLAQEDLQHPETLAQRSVAMDSQSEGMNAMMEM